jgi:alanine dehydrogenase
MGGSDGQVLVLGGADVDALLDPVTCIAAVEEAFGGQHAAGAPPAGVLGLHAGPGGFHVKAAASAGWTHFAAKVNANFPDNPVRLGLPTIQGVVILFDGTNGVPLAILDSVRITAIRTAAASAVAAKYLAPRGAVRLFIVGCGTQARAHLEALGAVRRIERVVVRDLDPRRATSLVAWINATGIAAVVTEDITAARESDIIVTCTPSRSPILDCDHVSPGSFIAAVGADNEHKQEIHPDLMRRARVVADSREQCVKMGDMRGAIAAGTMTESDIFADLAEIVAGRKGRSSDQEVIVFDSTGIAVEDVAAAAAVYRRALESGRGALVRLREEERRPAPDAAAFERHRFIR